MPSSLLPGLDINRRNVAVALLFVTSIACVGAWPHLRFSSEVGRLAFFKGAYDEDTYALFWMRDQLPGYRLLSGFLLDLIHLGVHGGLNATLIAAGVLLPALAAAAAYCFASEIVTTLPTRALLAALLLFGQDLLSLKDSVVWTSPGPARRFEALFGGLGSTLVPAYDTSYLGLFRIPEPQCAYTGDNLIVPENDGHQQGADGQAPVRRQRPLFQAPASVH